MEKRKLNNEGFSLIELIVVIAIMAILVGALAPTLIKYIERSREAADIQVLGSVYTAVQTAMLDPVVTDAPNSYDNSLTSLSNGTFKTEVTSTLGGDLNKVNQSLKSKKAKTGGAGVSSNSIKLTISGNDITVTAGTLSVDAAGSHQ